MHMHRCSSSVCHKREHYSHTLVVKAFALYVVYDNALMCTMLRQRIDFKIIRCLISDQLQIKTTSAKMLQLC